LLGDVGYCPPKLLEAVQPEYRFDRPLLHAYELDFCHPRSSTKLRHAAPLPDDMLTFLQSFNSGGNIQEEDLSVYLKNTELGHVAFPDIFDAAGYLRPETVEMLKWEEDWRPGPVIPASPS
jgi:hypothetical protein